MDLLALQTTLLGLSCTSYAPEQKSLYIATDALSTIAVLCAVALSVREHVYSARPSLVLQSYLLVTMGSDITQARTVWRVSDRPGTNVYGSVFTSLVVAVLGALCLETMPKAKSFHSGERLSPEETAGIFGITTFSWLNRVLITGYKKTMADADLPPLDRTLGSALRSAGCRADRLKDSTRRHSRRVLSDLIGKLALPLSWTVVPRICLATFSFAQCFLIQSVLRHLQKPRTETSKNDGYALIMAAFLVYGGIAASTSWYWYLHERTLCMVRSKVCRALYAKTIVIKGPSDSNAASVTLMSTEVDRLRTGLRDLHDIWCCPIEAAVATWLLYRQLGAATVAPVAVVIVTTAISALFARGIPKRQRAWVHAIQQRIGHTAAVVTGLESVHLSGLAAPAQQALQKMREDEIAKGQCFRVRQILVVTLAFFPTHLSPVFAFMVTSADLTITAVFLSMAYIMLLANPLSHLFQTVPQLLAAWTSFGRVRDFLDREPREDYRKFTRAHSEKHPQAAITILDCTFGWKYGHPILTSINANIPRGDLTLIVGKTGSGKTTICRALLAELAFVKGSITFHGVDATVIGLCEQNPYLFDATIRENILGFSEFDQASYDTVIEATMLTEDFKVLEKGDSAPVGSNGSNLSGGQKRRVALARALYARPSIYIFDDVLSGLDIKTQQHILQRVLGPNGMLLRSGATLIFATSDEQYVQNAAYVISLKPDSTCATRKIIACTNQQGSVAKSSSIASHELTLSDKNDVKSYSGSTMESISPEVSEPEHETQPAIADVSVPCDSEFASERATGNLRMYKDYLEANGKLPLIIFAAFALMYAFCFNFSNVWLKYWIQDSFKRDKPFYLGTFALLKVTTLLGLFLTTVVGFIFITKISGARLHDDLLHALISAPLYFLSASNTGTITALFSQDINLIDGELPQSIANAILNTLVAVGMAAVLAAASPYILLSLPIIAVGLYVIQKVYLRTSRQVRLLDLEAKAPLYTHFLETITGIASIRAYSWGQHLSHANTDLLESSQRPAYVLAMIQRWLAFVLCAIVTALATLLVALAVVLRSDAAISGASLISLLNLSEVLHTIVEFVSRMESAIVTMGRLRAFISSATNHSPTEIDTIPIDPAWPTAGKIELDEVNASYSGTRSGTVTSMAIQDLTLTVHAGSKLALVGKSGSGKSTIIRLIMRLLDPCTPTGRITVDNIVLRHVDRAVVRRRIIVVSQMAVFLPSASFKSNLDPFDHSTAASIWGVIQEVGLRDLILSRGGLNADLNPTTISEGEKQLLSLARAVLKRSNRGAGGILLLDEPGSTVDAAVHEKMWKIINREFADCTIVAALHRLDDDVLETFDRIVVMHEGRAVEDGAPKVLADTEGSLFKDMLFCRDAAAKDT